MLPTIGFRVLAVAYRDLQSSSLHPGGQRPTGSGKSKLDPYCPEIESLLVNGSAQKFIARRCRTTEANLDHWLEKHGIVLHIADRVAAGVAACGLMSSNGVPETADVIGPISIVSQAATPK